MVHNNPYKENEKNWFDAENKDIYDSLEKEQLIRMKEYRFNEIEPYFVCCSIRLYKKIEQLPKHLTIIDLGCNNATQSIYYEDFARYIGVDSCIPSKYRYHTANSLHYDMTLETFIEKELPSLVENEIINLDNTLAISYLVPSKNLELISKNFKYCQIFYPGGYCFDNLQELKDEKRKLK